MVVNAAPPADGSYCSEVAAVAVTGDPAAVKVTNDYLGTRFTGYLSLLKLADGWVVVNNQFHHHPGLVS